MHFNKLSVGCETRVLLERQGSCQLCGTCFCHVTGRENLWLPSSVPAMEVECCLHVRRG